MTVTVVPTSNIAKTISVFRHMIAQSATFQTLVNAVDDDAAKASIDYFWACGEPDNSRCVVRHANQTEFSKVAQYGFAVRSTVVAYFELLVPEDYRDNYQNAGLDFLNKIGAIHTEIQSFMVSDSTGNSLDAQFVLATESMGQYDNKKNNGLPFWCGEILCSYRGG